MGRSRRKYKKSRPKVKVGLPKKNPHVFKPAFNVPPKLRALIGEKKWDEKGTVIRNYKSLGIVSNPNLLGARSRTPQILESESIQLPPPRDSASTVQLFEFDPVDSGSDVEEDDLKSELGKKQRDRKTAPVQPLTSMQRVCIGWLIEKYCDDYESMFMDTNLNAMQHSVATLQKLCKRFHEAKKGNLYLAK